MDKHSYFAELGKYKQLGENCTPENHFNEAFKLPQNSGGALILSFTKLCCHHTDEKNRVNNAVSFFFSVMLQLVSISFQLGMMALIVIYPLEGAVDGWDFNILQETDALKRSIRHLTSVDKMKTMGDIPRRAIDLCMTDHTIPFSQSVLVWLWVLKMLPSIMSNFHAVNSFMQLPTVFRDDNIPLYYMDGKKTVITNTRAAKGVAFGLLCIMPELLVNCTVLWVGMKFLVYCTSLTDLVTKSISFFFFTQIDEVLYEGLASEDTKGAVSATVMEWRRENRTKDSWSRDTWNLRGSTVFRSTVSLIVTVVYTMYIHAEMRGFRRACFEYKTLINPLCKGQGPNCGWHLMGVSAIVV